MLYLVTHTPVYDGFNDDCTDMFTVVDAKTPQQAIEEMINDDISTNLTFIDDYDGLEYYCYPLTDEMAAKINVKHVIQITAM